MNNYEYDESYFQYLTTKRPYLLQVIRNIFLNSAVKLTNGPTLDFGCGKGEQLALLEKNSIGVEINPHCVRFGKDQGMDVRLFNPKEDLYLLKMVAKEEKMQSFLCSHVLEHLENPLEALTTLAGSCHRLGITQMVLIVPGIAGFKSDDSHKTFLNMDFFQKVALPHFKLKKARYFPFPFAYVGNILKYNELQVVFELDSNDLD